ncbi:MAG TPA: hypothetical protein VKK81_11550 [Candidatus Binatia bacterium]|nr:hypothetical protein [Candidatus Binatia bacterium]
MRQQYRFTAVVLASALGALFLSVPHDSIAGFGHQHRGDIRADRRDIRADRRDIRADRHDHELGDLARDRQDLHQDRRDLRQDLSGTR